MTTGDGIAITPDTAAIATTTGIATTIETVTEEATVAEIGAEIGVEMGAATATIDAKFPQPGSRVRGRREAPPDFLF